MNYLLLALCVIFVGVQSLFHKEYAVRTHDPVSVYAFNMFACAASALTMIIAMIVTGDGFSLHLPTLIYGLIFGAGFIGATTALNVCVECGPMSMTNLIMDFSVVLPTVWAVIFLGDSFRLTTGVGFVLLIISLWMFNHKNETLDINRKWLLWVIILFCTNGGCAVLQRVHQDNFPGLYQKEFLLIGMLVNTVFDLIVVLAFRDKTGIKNACKYGVTLAAPEGVCNILANLLIMILNNRIPSTVEYPVVAAGAIIMAFIWAVFIYKEKMTKLQTAGFIVAVVSIIVLNL